MDLFRAVGIVLMIMGHIYFGYRFDLYIHAFHMPMFFFCSGFFYRACDGFHDACSRILRKAKTLLLPYFSFALFHFLVVCLQSKSIYRDALYLFIWNTEQAGFPIAGALWFLTALFFAEAIYILLDCVLPSRVVLTTVSFALALLGTLTARFFPVRLPFGLDAALVGIGFLHMARLLRGAKKPLFAGLLHLRFPFALVLFITASFLIFRNGFVNLRTGSYASVPLFWLNGFLSIIALWNLCQCADALFAKFAAAYDFVLRIGRDSIVYLGLNQLVILYITPLITRIPFPLLAQKLIILLLTLVVLELLRFIMTHTKLRVLVGK